MRVLSGLAPDGSPARGVGAIYHSLDPLERTGAQIGLLRSVIDTAGQFVFDSKNPVEGREANAEVAKQAAKTLGMALAQLDNIIDDQPRWMSGGGESERASKALMEAEKSRIDSEVRLQKEALRPFHMLRAKLYKTRTGQILATNESESVYAFGNTAEEAVNKFDEAYKNQRHLPFSTDMVEVSPDGDKDEPPAPAPAPIRKPRRPKI
jgi:hypothetical protein